MNKKQIDRIRKMEAIYNQAVNLVNEFDKLAEEYKAEKSNIKELVDYYQSELWVKDYDDDNNGLIPNDLPRGILSEDSIYDLIADINRIEEMMKNSGGLL